MSSYRIPRVRHARYTSMDRIERRRKLNAFLENRFQAMENTGSAVTFALTATAAGVKGASQFTFSGQPSDGDSVNVGGYDYLFGTGGIAISADVAAAALLSGEDQPADTETVTIGVKTYIFKTALSV